LEDPEENRKKIIRYAFLSACVVVTAVILWSFITETLFPLYKSGQQDEFLYNIIGFPIILIGTGIFVYGGIVFYRDTKNLFENPELFLNIETIRNKTAPKESVKSARMANTKMLFTAWKKGFFRLMVGAVLIALGGITINLKKIIE
jgi:hypothetical protein